MSKKQYLVDKVDPHGTCTKIRLHKYGWIELRPFLYLKKKDILSFIPSIRKPRVIYKLFIDKATKTLKKVKIFPPYSRKEFIYLNPHKFEITFRERKSEADWKEVKDLERFHYRGQGLNKIVGRRTVLIAEMKDFGIIGFGVISSTVAAVGPRFKLLNTNFSEQMRTRLINQIIRIPRIVIHPEFRGLNLGVLMAKHLTNYAREYWDVNHYKPIMIEVIAAMTEYHKFFEKAGFVSLGFTNGYKGVGIMPMYGNGSFDKRDPSKYKFLKDQRKKPYLVYPLTRGIKNKLLISFAKKDGIEFLTNKNKLKKQLSFKKLSLKYKIKNGATKRTKIVKEIFGVDSENAFSPVTKDFSLDIEPKDVVLITGASGSGKSTLLKLLIKPRSVLRKSIQWTGAFPRIKKRDLEILDTNFNLRKPLINQVKIREGAKEAIKLLNSVGLTEAHLYIKRPHQISDGQKYRFAIAQLCDTRKPIWIADEFASTLNPEIAAVVAKGLRRIAYKNGATLILAAPHVGSFIDSLLPNKLIKLRWGGIAKIYAMKITNFHCDNKILSFSIINNGSSILTSVKIGLFNLSGALKTKYYFNRVLSGEKKDIKIKIINSENIYGIGVKSAEGVGDIIYKKFSGK